MAVVVEVHNTGDSFSRSELVAMMIAEGDALLCLADKVLLVGMMLASSLFFFVGDDFDRRI